MLYIIRTSTLLGQSIIAYLQQKGFPEVYAHVLRIITAIEIKIS
jgi:coatomer protein complex subunit alpha (xenin)